MGDKEEMPFERAAGAGGTVPRARSDDVVLSEGARPVGNAGERAGDPRLSVCKYVIQHYISAAKRQ